MKKACWRAVKRYNELNYINNDELSSSAIKYYNIS